VKSCLAGVPSAVAAHLSRYQHQVAIVQRYRQTERDINEKLPFVAVQDPRTFDLPDCCQDLPPPSAPDLHLAAAASSHLGGHRSPHTAHIASIPHFDGDCGIAGSHETAGLFTKGPNDIRNGGCR
jgi:hypothetical protein